MQNLTERYYQLCSNAHFRALLQRVVHEPSGQGDYLMSKIPVTNYYTGLSREEATYTRRDTLNWLNRVMYEVIENHGVTERVKIWMWENHGIVDKVLTMSMIMESLHLQDTSGMVPSTANIPYVLVKLPVLIADFRRTVFSQMEESTKTLISTLPPNYIRLFCPVDRQDRQDQKGKEETF